MKCQAIGCDKEATATLMGIEVILIKEMLHIPDSDLAHWETLAVCNDHVGELSEMFKYYQKKVLETKE